MVMALFVTALQVLQALLVVKSVSSFFYYYFTPTKIFLFFWKKKKKKKKKTNKQLALVIQILANMEALVLFKEMIILASVHLVVTKKFVNVFFFLFSWDGRTFFQKKKIKMNNNSIQPMWFKSMCKWKHLHCWRKYLYL